MRVGGNFALRLSFVLLLSASTVIAQKGGSGGGSGSGGGGGSKNSTAAPTSYSSGTALNGYQPVRDEAEFDSKPILTPSAQQRLKNELPPCFHWPMNPVLSGTVNAGSMEVPAPALEQFSQGCAAARKKDLKEAQQHLNKAVKLSPKFAAAWTLLGQAQEDQGKDSNAVQSCTQAKESDPSYLPARLCLADVAARQEKWDQVLELTDQIIALHPVRSPGAFYYNALAYLQHHQTPTAEKSALRALDDSEPQQKSEVYWLLAKIYEQKGDRSVEADQLHAYLKLAPHGHQADLARRVLREIESPAATSSEPGAPK